MKYNKIFVIGFHKTATTSFVNFFNSYGINSRHSTRWDLNNHDVRCFSDGHLHTLPFDPDNIYSIPSLDARFENSLFILNTRKLNDWLWSFAKHVYRKQRQYPIDENRKMWRILKTNKFIDRINNRKNHHLRVLEYFSYAPEKLIIVDIGTHNWQHFVANYVELDVPSNSNIRKNVTSTKVPKKKSEWMSERIREAYIKTNTMPEDMDRLDIPKKYLNIYNNNILVDHRSTAPCSQG